MDKFLKVLKAVVQFFPRLFKAVFGTKSEKIKNKNLFKRGGYAVAVIALVIAAAIVVNVLVGLLAQRVTLEFDLTSDKKNSISGENEEYIRTVDKDVVIYIMASSPEEYYGGYMEYYANQMGCSSSTSDYYVQATRFLERYTELNDKITVKYMDPYGTQMAEIKTKYPESLYYGDILVTCQFETQEKNKIDNYRLLSFEDIYTVEDTSGMAAMNMDYYYITGSNLETSLTSAIASVTSAQTKNVAFLASRSKPEVFDYFRSFLELNNFKVQDIEDKVIKDIPDTFDAVVLCAPTADFTKEEIDALSRFLDNGGKLNKTLLFYGDTGNQNLPNLYDFLAEWGIAVESGIVMESDVKHHVEDNHSLYISYLQDNSPVTLSQVFISGYNVPMYENGKAYAGRETQTLIATNGSSVIMPVSSDVTVAPAEHLERRKLSCAIISKQEDFDNEVLKGISSRVIAFSSIDFISEQYITAYASSIDYKGASLNLLRYSTGMNDVTMVFEKKTIDSTNELYVISSSAAITVRWIFIGIIPVAVLVLAFVIFYKRRNK